MAIHTTAKAPAAAKLWAASWFRRCKKRTRLRDVEGRSGAAEAEALIATAIGLSAGAKSRAGFCSWTAKDRQRAACIAGHPTSPDQ
eukprot:CAMPEP_0119105070 /NCGR_PEP_ID=MMETSP1180-20130426/3131_1 /TAXON_ID=3052 ORGANISM="Chlamydomonas cf sp, Strain CCMP681" /NCGR_SAMPLE_ID=MMETSP1180 /ASSEMBLY_ACC=CAM_ASM_000741 /LENGTH=85 /DNA_ID=CAMNT_0007090019 /DNA_START=94 /DNA_END=352 /DNA_ORIENTATION=+